MKNVSLSLLVALGIFSSTVHAADCDVALAGVESAGVETSEVELKYLASDLGALPEDVRASLLSGRSHPDILRRGFVLQEYIPVSAENLRLLFAELLAAGVPFGTAAQQNDFLAPGVAKEIRLMSKSILIGDVRTHVLQATIKGAGGVSIAQLESPEALPAPRVESLGEVFKALRPRVTTTVRKLYFELAAGPRTIEVDIFLGRSGVAGGPIFINGELEFHGATPADATAAAEAFRADPALRPAYLSEDLTERAGLKSRDIAARGVPPEITILMKPARATNYAFARDLALQFEKWADADVAREVLYPSVNLPVAMIDPVVFAPTDLAAAVRHFREEGYVVLDHVSAAADRERIVELMDRAAAIGPQTRRLGFMDIYHDDALAQVRQDPGLHAVFAELFGTEKLWVVFDRVMYWRQDEPESPLPPHVDQNPVTHPGFFAAQGMLALRDMNEGTGTLALAPGSHRDFERYAPLTRPGAGFVEFEGQLPWTFNGLRLKAGQIVIWDSRVTHGRTRGEPRADRYAALITFAPARDDEQLRARRLAAFAAGVGAYDHDAGLRATASPRYERSLRETAERLTPLGRRLYGLDSWFTR